MWRRTLHSLSTRKFSSQPQFETLYSFLQPSVFAVKRTNQTQQQIPQKSPLNQISQTQKSDLETSLQQSISDRNTDEAWKSFKALTNRSSFPTKPLANSLITHLSSLTDTLNLKRSFAAVVYLIEKNPSLIEHETVRTLFNSMKIANAGAPAFALVKTLFKNRFLVPFDYYGGALVEICRKNGSLNPFLNVFNQSCAIAIEEKIDYIKPDLDACNAVLECYSRELESVEGAEKLIEKMSILRVKPNQCTFGSLAYLYALKGLHEKLIELEDLMERFDFSDKSSFFHSVISGYVKSGNFESVSSTVLRCLNEENRHGSFSVETYNEIVKGFLQNGNLKDLANLIVESQKVEPSHGAAEETVGYGVISACVDLGVLDQAHRIVDEMNNNESSIGVGVYVPILKAYRKEQRTAEAAQLVSEITSLGLRLDLLTYDSLIEVSMSCQDFQSAFSLFRDMRESRINELMGSYLTIMTGLTEHHRPELMAAFLDEIVDDPRIKIGTHDWNSIIHAFCKSGRLEDAKRTFRRMVFLQFEPNAQTYLSMINGYVNMEKYFSVLMLWNEVKRKVSFEGDNRFVLDSGLVDAFLYALVKGGFFDAVMQVVEKSQSAKIYVDKWRYKQAYMETHKKMKVAKLRKKRFRKMESLIAFKNWAGLSS